VLALASAVGYGGSDFAGGLAARKASVIMVSFLAMACSLILTLAVLPWMVSGAPPAAALAWGAVAGLGGMSGALALYAGFRRAAFSVAGPLSAVSAAGLSVIMGVLFGERPSPMSLAGIGIALPAIVLVSLTATPSGPGGPSGPGELPAGPGSHPVPDPAAGPASRGAWAGVSSGLVAGVGFALLFVGLNRAGSRAGIWPVLSGQATEVIVLGCLVAATGGFRNGTGRAGRSSSTAILAAFTGVLGGAGTILYFLATHHGFLAITAVLTSLYPAVTIGLARVVASERLSAVRLAGLVLAGISVTLIALGGAS
jgi:drug/metabolite transporter (DMT)-like permease